LNYLEGLNHGPKAIESAPRDPKINPIICKVVGISLRNNAFRVVCTIVCIFPSAETGPEIPLAIAWDKNINATILKKLAITIQKNISFPNSSIGRRMKDRTTRILDTIEDDAIVRFAGHIFPLIFATFTHTFLIAKRTGVHNVINTASPGDIEYS